MSRVFNICFSHQGLEYTALLSLSVPDEYAKIRVHKQEGTIQIILSNGELVFSTAEVIRRLQRQEDPDDMVRITNTISMQLLNTSCR